MSDKRSRRREIKKRLAKEYLRCSRDQRYFMRKYCYIQSQETGGKIKFDLYPFQERALREIQDHRFNVILKSRQMGISTLMAGVALHQLLFTSDSNVTIVALKQDVAKGLLKKVKIMHENLPAWMREGTPVDNQYSVEFSNGSFVQAASSSSSTAGRSESLSLLIIDEAAFIRGAAELWSSAKPTLSTGGRAVVLSTPYGVGSWYHQIWKDALNGADVVSDEQNLEVWDGTGVNGFHPIKLHWSLHPDRNDAWRAEMGRDMAPREAAREYDCVSGSALVYTRTGLRPLREVEVGDLVLTHRGRFRPVTNKQRVHKDDVLRVHTRNNRRHCSVSAEHPLLTPGGWARTGDLENRHEVAQFPEAVDLSDFCSPGTADITEEIDPSPYRWERDEESCWKTDRWGARVRRRVTFDRDVGWLLGYYMAEGHCAKAVRSVTFTYNAETEGHLADEVERVVRERINPNVTAERRRTSGKAGQIVFNCSVLRAFLRRYTVGRLAHEKRLHGDAYALGDATFLSGMISGVMDGDGMTRTECSKRIGCTSAGIVDDVQFAASVLGYPATTKRVRTRDATTEIMGRPVTQQRRFHIVNFLKTRRVPVTEGRFVESLVESECLSRHKTHIRDGFVWTDIRTEPGEPQDLYDIEVDEDESFVTEHFVAHNCAFESSGNTVIDPEIIKRVDRESKETPSHKVRVRGQNGLWVWEEPDFSRRYVIGADVARGDAGDYSAACVFEMDTMRQVAEYQGKIYPGDFGNFLCGLGAKYNDAVLVVERNSHGWETLQAIHRREYRNLLWTTNDLRFVDVSSTTPSRKKMKPGINTSGRTKQQIVTKFEEWVRKGHVSIRSGRLIEEMRTFVWVKPDKAEHMQGYNDDLIDACMFAVWARDTALAKSARAQQAAEASVRGITATKGEQGRGARGRGRGLWTAGGREGDPYRDPATGSDLRWLVD